MKNDKKEEERYEECKKVGKEAQGDERIRLRDEELWMTSSVEDRVSGSVKATSWNAHRHEEEKGRKKEGEGQTLRSMGKSLMSTRSKVSAGGKWKRGRGRLMGGTSKRWMRKTWMKKPGKWERR